MYLSFFGLNEKPFAITPDPRYLFLSERHAEALAHLLYGINEAGGFVQLTGEVGTGKTTVIRSLLAQTPANAEIALILNPRMTAPEFLLTICEELGIGVPDKATTSLKDLVDILSHYLLKAHGNGMRIVLVVDEAQNLAPDVLEQVRLLTNLETNTQKLLQIILIGQPELRELLGRNELRQLAQRVTGRYHLDPLSQAETTQYVSHRLRVAGATTDIFTPLALSEIYRLSGGVPRLINVICDRALLGAYAQDIHRIDSGLVRRSASEVFGRSVLPRWFPWATAVTAAVVLILGSIVLWRFAPWESSRSTTATAAAAEKDPPAGAIEKLNEQSPASSLPAATAVPTSQNTTAFSNVLARNARETDPDDAFSRLFALWGVRYVAGGADPCTQATRLGLECFVQQGSFAQLRIYNRPAILLLTDETGSAHQIVMSSLDDESASVELGGAPLKVSIAELSRYWFGDFVLLWKPGTSEVKPLSYGMRGEQVRQLRLDLQKVQGVSLKQPDSDLYDAELSTLVRNFQRQHRLTVDGVAGLQTLVVLNSAMAGEDSPLLQSPSNHGG